MKHPAREATAAITALIISFVMVYVPILLLSIDFVLKAIGWDTANFLGHMTFDMQVVLGGLIAIGVLIILTLFSWVRKPMKI